MEHYKVVAAVIVHNDEILCVQKGEHKFDYLRHKYEFPGGKVESGEREEDALIREIDEELGLAISVDRKIAVVNHQYPDFMITLAAYLCVSSIRKVELTEHIDAKWLPRSALKTLHWAGADQPIVQFLLNSSF
ncbi:(deoxy)nucleoside triphosphate pyrophosphohydrolase [Olivibacter sp. SDN3]|uniref:(deoxy)nucleoside triphosphate pyrophosphohydrolase n=1 Tax=Olivibacter sp. SDN3 TaxID=2764720 RepID=UPI001650DAED|nr:(deoxy)nucleoside triphosphate pyrophosphohydrolase [Olivibacter sp. SDN3]QNL48273.1 (deoxy)nucleoside triphosphate pyrophosphohydrolase [Olivibacter sp. SDN3]